MHYFTQAVAILAALPVLSLAAPIDAAALSEREAARPEYAQCYGDAACYAKVKREIEEVKREAARPEYAQCYGDAA